MSNLDFIQPSKDYVEKTTKEFLEHYGLADKFAVIEKKADEALFNKSVSEHFNEFTNGAVDAVAAETGQSKDEVMEAFSKYYYSGKFD